MAGRRILGIIALAALVAGVNLLVWRQTLLEVAVLAPFLAGLGLGVVWLGWTLRAAMGASFFQGRTFGGVNAAFASAVVLAICIVAYVLVESLGISIDLTREGRRSLAPQTVQVLQTMSEEVTATCIFLDVDDELFEIGREQTVRFLERCQQYTDLLTIESLDPQVDVSQLEGMNISHVSTQGTVVIRAGNRQRAITLSGGSPRLEEREFTNALVNVLRGSEPTVAFLTGHSERRIDDPDERTGGSLMKELLLRESYAPEQIGIPLSHPAIAPDTSILAINAPKSDLYPQEIEAIDKFMDGGGRLLVLLNPGMRDPENIAPKEFFIPWLESRFGIVVARDVATADLDGERGDVRVELRTDSGPFEQLDEDPSLYRGSYNARHPITRTFDEVMLMNGARTVRPAADGPEDVTVTNLIRTQPRYWAETNLALLTEAGRARKDETDREGPLSLAVAAVQQLEDPPEGAPSDARVVVVGDADFASNGQLSFAGHFNFLFNSFAWLSESEELIAIRPTGKDDPPLILSEGEERAVGWISVLFTTQAVAAAGLVTYLLRRRYR